MNEQDWIDVVIENWARWFRQSILPRRRHCLSIEHHYVSPQRRHWPNDAPPFEVRVVNVPAALEVEDAWRALPFVCKMVLKQWYVLRVAKHKICKSLRQKGYPMREQDFDLEVARAKILLDGKLAESTACRSIGTSVVPCATQAQVGGLRSLQEAA